jgi:chromosome segregation ATPase
VSSESSGANSKQLAKQLQTLEVEFSGLMNAFPGKATNMIAFIEQNLVPRLYQPIIERELERQAQKREEEESEVNVLRD